MRANPNDVDAASSLGRCSFRDYSMIAPGGDSAQLEFRSSWSAALRALRHAVGLDPANSRAYQPLFSILFADSRDGCSAATGDCTHVSPVTRDGDSLITIPRLVRLNVPGVDTYDDVIRESHATWRGNLTEARAHAERWAAVAPDDRRPHEYLGRALLRLGNAAAAATELERAATLGTVQSRRQLFWDRFEALVRSDRGNDVRRVLDEAENDPGRDTTRLRGTTFASLNAVVGRYRPPQVDSTRARLARARFEAALRNAPPRPPREQGFSELLAAGDTVGARRALARLDSRLPMMQGDWRMRRVAPDQLAVAESFLSLRDTADAEARLAEIEQVFDDRRFEYNFSLIFADPRPWMGRAWSLSGDLAAARGRREEAARMYRRVIGLWSGGDPDLQSVVDHARARLSSLSGR